MKSPLAESNHLPIYEDLVREYGDVVTEAQMAAAHTRNQAAELLNDSQAAPPRHSHHRFG